MEQHGQVARQAACYQGAMEQLVRLDIPKALPILANYLTVMSDLIVHPDARWKNVDEDRCVNNVVGCVNNVDVNDAGDHSANPHVDKPPNQGIWTVRKLTSSASGLKTGVIRC